MDRRRAQGTASVGGPRDVWGRMGADSVLCVGLVSSGRGRFDVRNVKGNATTEESRPQWRRRRRRSAMKVNRKGTAENWKSCLTDRPTEETDHEILSVFYSQLISGKLNFSQTRGDLAALSNEPFVRVAETRPSGSQNTAALRRSSNPIPFRPNFHGPTIKAVTQLFTKP